MGERERIHMQYVRAWTHTHTRTQTSCLSRSAASIPAAAQWRQRGVCVGEVSEGEEREREKKTHTG